MASTDAIPVPRKNTAYRFYFAIRKPSDSTLITTWAGQDSEVSLDGAAFSDCTNEATEIGTSGCGYIDLTSSEMNADNVLLKVTVTNTGAVPLVFALYPESAGDYRVADTQKVDVDTIKTNPVVNGGTVTFPTGATLASTTNITAASGVTVSAIGSGVITAASIASDAITDAKVASDVTIASVTGAVGSVTGNVGGNVVGSVASVVAGVDLSTTALGAIWNRLTSSMTTAGSIGKKLADWVLGTDSKAMLSTDAQTGVVLPRVTLVDTTTTNTDMRGTDNAALAATALSTAQWTNTLATNLGTTNTTVATNLDAAISSRMATYTQPTGFLAATFPGTVASTTNITAASGVVLSSAGVRAIWTDDWYQVAFSADTPGGYVQAMATDIDGLVTTSAAVQDRVSYCLTVLVGACSDAGTSAETYVHAIGGETFTVDFTGLDATGNRTTTTLSKV